MNKRILLAFAITCSSLCAMQQQEELRIVEYDGVHPDSPNIAEIPEEWKKRSINQLLDEMNPKNRNCPLEEGKGLFSLRQLIRWQDCWRLIDDLQERFPEKIQITVNHSFAQKHTNSFFFLSLDRANHGYINELVERIKRVEAELGIKRTNPGESHE